VRDGDLVEPAAGVDDVDRAPVGQARHGEARDALQRLLVIQRRRERLAGLREEALAQLGLLGLGDVFDHADRQQLAARRAQRRGLDEPPALLAGLAVHDARQQRLGRQPVDDLPARDVLGLQRPAVLVRGVPRRGDAAKWLRQQILRAGVAEQVGGRLVGVADAPRSVRHRDRLGEVGEHAVELLARGAELADELELRAAQPRAPPCQRAAGRERAGDERDHRAHANPPVDRPSPPGMRAFCQQCPPA
jgi:hypothetical protein